MRFAELGPTLAIAALFVACGVDGTEADTDPGSTGETSDPTQPGTTTSTSMGGTSIGTSGGMSSEDTGSTTSTSIADGTESGSESSSSTGEAPEVPVGVSGAYRVDSALSFSVFDIAAHPDGGVVIVGNVLRDPAGANTREAAIAHLDDDGSVVWALRSNAPTNEQFFGVLVTDDAVYGAGLTRRNTGMGNNNEIRIAEFALDGTYAGSVIVGNPGSEEHAWDMIATSSGGFALGGYTDQTGFGDRDGLLVGFDGDLQVQWTAGFGGAGVDQFYTLTEDTDGGILGVGMRGTGAPGSDSMIVKVSTDGAVVFSASFGDGGTDAMRGVQPIAAGGYLIVGETSSWGAGGTDGYFGTFDPAADPAVSISTVGGGSFDALRTLLPVGNERFVVGGQAGSVSMTEDGWLARLDASAGIGLDWQFVYDAPQNQRMVTGAGAVRLDGGLALGVHDFGNPDALRPAVIYTDSLGGMDPTCPDAVADPFAPEPVAAVAVDITINQGAPTFTRTPLSAAAEPFVALDLGPPSVLCR